MTSTTEHLSQILDRAKSVSFTRTCTEDEWQIEIAVERKQETTIYTVMNSIDKRSVQNADHDLLAEQLATDIRLVAEHVVG